MDWQKVAADFEPEGFLRDVYVLDTDLGDYDNVFAALQGLEPGGLHVRADAGVPLPASGRANYQSWPLGVVGVHVQLAGMRLNWHCFGQDEIEFDLDLREVTGQVQLDALLAFICLLGQATNKAVLLTPQSWRKSPIFRYVPESKEFIWLRPR